MLSGKPDSISENIGQEIYKFFHDISKMKTYLWWVGNALVKDKRRKSSLLKRPQRSVAQPGGPHPRVSYEEDGCTTPGGGGKCVAKLAEECTEAGGGAELGHDGAARSKYQSC